MRYVKWHKHDLTAVGFAAVVIGLFTLITGWVYQDGWTQLIGASMFFTGLFCLKDK